MSKFENYLEKVREPGSEMTEQIPRGSHRKEAGGERGYKSAVSGAQADIREGAYGNQNDDDAVLSAVKDLAGEISHEHDIPFEKVRDDILKGI